jgi:hypothetical protein
MLESKLKKKKGKVIVGLHTAGFTLIVVGAICNSLTTVIAGIVVVVSCIFAWECV